MFMVGQVIVELGWVDFDLDVPSSYPTPEPILPISHMPMQNGAVRGIPKINVNKTHVRDHQI